MDLKTYIAVLFLVVISFSTIETSRRANIALFKQSAKCPRIVTRAEWGALHAKAKRPIHRPVSKLLIHHTETPSCTTKVSCVKAVQSIQKFHMENKGWDDIGYNFLVGEDQTVYEGRGWANIGAHARGWNPTSYGIAVIGNFSKVLPNQGTIRVVKQLIQCGQKKNISSSYTVHGHRDGVCTTCPGDAFYQRIQTWNHYGGKLDPIYC